MTNNTIDAIATESTRVNTSGDHFTDATQYAKNAGDDYHNSLARLGLYAEYDHSLGVQENLQKAGMDFEFRLANSEEFGIGGKTLILRETGGIPEMAGTLSTKTSWNPVNHAEVMEFAIMLAEKHGGKVTGFGPLALGIGSYVNIQFESFDVMGDAHILRVTIQNYNDGKRGLTISEGVVRLACFNGMMLRSINADMARVTKRGGLAALGEKISKAGTRTGLMIQESVEKYTAEAEKLLNIEISDSEALSILQHAYGKVKETKDGIAAYGAAVKAFEGYLNGIGQAEVKGTVYGLIQAATYNDTWAFGRGDNAAENRLLRQFDGAKETTAIRAIAEKLANTKTKKARADIIGEPVRIPMPWEVGAYQPTSNKTGDGDGSLVFNF